MMGIVPQNGTNALIELCKLVSRSARWVDIQHSSKDMWCDIAGTCYNVLKWEQEGLFDIPALA